MVKIDINYIEFEIDIYNTSFWFKSFVKCYLYGNNDFCVFSSFSNILYLFFLFKI